MRKMFAIPLLATLIAASPAPPRVEVATGDWSQLPYMPLIGYSHLNSSIMSKVYEIGRQHRCKLPGQFGSHIDMSVSFAVQFTPEGKLARLLLPPLNCPEAESWLGGTLVQSIEKGDYRPQAQNLNLEGWYRGEINFYYEG